MGSKSILFGDPDEVTAIEPLAIEPLAIEPNPMAEGVTTFAAAASRLTRQEMEFCNLIVKGEAPAAAAKRAFPAKKSINSAALLRQPEIVQAIALGKRELAIALQRETNYDMATAARDLEARIAAASLAGQHSAVASLTALRLKLHGLLIERAEVQSAGFVINVSGVDVSKMAGPAPIDGDFSEDTPE